MGSPSCFRSCMKGKNKEISGLEVHLGYWLRYVSNQVSHSFAQKVQAKGVTVAEWVLLRQLYDGESRPGQLAQSLGLTRGAISKLSERLLNKGLIDRNQEEDGRAHCLKLNARGRQLIPVLSRLADQNDEEYFGHLEPEIRKMIQCAMEEIVQMKGLKSKPIG